MFFFSMFLYVAIALLLVLRHSNEVRASRFIISLFITISALNILVIQTLHFLRLLNNPLAYLLVQVFLCVLCALLIIDPKKKLFKTPLNWPQVSRNKISWVDSILFFFLCIILAGVFYVGTLSPINNSDSLQTHLPRMFYWLQHRSLISWYPTAATQLSYPVNITFLGLWAFLLSGSEMYLFVPMWLSLVAIAALVFEIALLLGAQREAAITASLVAISLPVVLMQTYSYQGDAFVAAQVLCVIFFLLLYSTQKKNTDLVLSALVMAIALGSKQTAILFLPIYLLSLLLLILGKTLNFRSFLNTILLAILFFGVFSSLKFVQNLTETQTDAAHMVNPGFVENLVEMDKVPVKGYLTNGFRYLYQAVSLDGLNGRLKVNLETNKKALFKKITSALDIDLEAREYLPEYEEGYFDYADNWAVSEDASWFGPLSFTLLPIAMVFTLVKKGKLHRWYLLLAFLLLLIFIFGQVVLKSDGWGAYRGRHMTIAVLALCPLVGFIIPRQRVIGKGLSLVIALIAFYLSSSVILINDNRPVITSNTINSYLYHKVEPVKITNIFNSLFVTINHKITYSLLLSVPDRLSILRNDYYGRLFFQDIGNIKDIEWLNTHLAGDTPLYLKIERSLLEYALFGPNRTRELYPVKSLDEVPPNSYLLGSNALIKSPPPGFSRLTQNPNYTLYFKP